MAHRDRSSSAVTEPRAPAGDAAPSARDSQTTARAVGSGPPAADGARRRWLTFLSIATIVLATSAVYFNSFAGQFVLDDHAWIQRNPNIHRLGSTGWLLNPVQPGDYGGRPVVSLSLAINYWLGSENPWGYHAVNLLIHILAALALFGIVRRTLSLPSLAEPPVDRFAVIATPLALAAVLLWAVHPLQTAAVTYVIQRTESLMGLFYLLTLYCTLRGATAARGALGWYLAAAASCCLGMGAKEAMATAPIVILLYDRTFLAGSFREALARRWGFYAFMCASWSIIVWGLIASEMRGHTTGFGVGEFTWWSYLRTQPDVLVHYLQLTIWPAGLCLDYGWPAASSAAEIVWPGLLIVGLLGLTVRALFKRPMLGFLGAWCFLILAPTSSFVPLRDAAFDHRMYLPLAALAVLVVLGGWTLCQQLAAGSARAPRRKSSAGGGNPAVQVFAIGAIGLYAAALVGLGAATISRNATYGSEVSILQDSLSKHGDHVRSLNNLASVLVVQGRPADAIPYARRAAELQPDSDVAWENLGVALDAVGQYDEALAAFAQWRALEPDDPVLHSNIGLTFFHQGKLAAAIEEYQRAIELNPQYAGAMDNLAIALLGRGDKQGAEEAMQWWRKALDVAPDFVPARRNFAKVLARTGKLDDAIREFRRALHDDPRDAKSHAALGITLVNKGQLADGAEQLRAAIENEPDSGRAVQWRIDMGSALFRLGRQQEARQAWREAIRRALPVQAGLLADAALGLAMGAPPAPRDANMALEFAARAAQLSQGQDPKIDFALACANAGVGDLKTAIRDTAGARLIAARLGRQQLVESLQKWLEFFQDKAAGRDVTPPDELP